MTDGSWETLSYLMPINPIHVNLMHDGKILVVAGSENNPPQHDASEYYAAVWNTQTRHDHRAASTGGICSATECLDFG